MLYFFYGEDIYRSRKKIREIEERFLALSGGGEASVRIEAAETDLPSMRAYSETASLFRDKRLIIIEGSREAAEDMREYIEEHIPAYAIAADVFVLWERGMKATDKKFVSLVKKHATKTQEFVSPTPASLRALLETELRVRERALPPDIKQHILLSARGDSWRLMNELDKVLLQKKDIHTITRRVQSEPNIFLFTDAFGARKKTVALQLFHQFREEGMLPDAILRALTWHVRTLAVVADLIGRGEQEAGIAKKAKLHPFVVKKAVIQSRNFSGAELAQLYNKLSQLDTDSKQNRGDISLGLEHILLAL